MVEAEDDMDEPFPGPVVVRRPIFDAGEKLRNAAPPGEGDTFLTARDMAHDHQARGETEQAAFWNEVADYLEERTCCPAGFEVIVLEDGEEWDADARKVRRRGKDQRRSGKGN